jgi:virulence factor
MSRDPARLNEVGDAWRVPARFTELETMIAEGLDAAFVHAATEAHPGIVERLLAARIPVYVDKPLADRLEICEHLVAMADQRRVSLMVGFNRRFAPDYAALAGRPRSLILMQKHRAGPVDAARRVVFDDFIHVVDTLRFLAPGPVLDTAIAGEHAGGQLRQVVLTLSGKGFTAIGAMSRESGADEETLEITGGGKRRRVVNLSETVDQAGAQTLVRRGDWTPVATQRGVSQACDFFLAAVGEGRLLSARDALETHRLCEEILAGLG